MRISKLASLVFMPLTVLITTVALMTPVNAAAVITPNSVYDNFGEILLKPNPDAYWWVINSGDDQIWEDYCGDASCITAESDNGVTYANLTLSPDNTPGYYTNADLAEFHTGYAYGDEGPWKPSFRHPIVVEARVRWVGDFHQNGSGDTVGTNGIWLWDSPVDIPNNTYHPSTSMGISWTNDGTLFAKGLAGTVNRLSIPVGIRKPLFYVNMNDWVDIKFEWSQSIIGCQSVNFWINGHWIGTEILQIPITKGLSLEMWHDNQTYGLFGATYESPANEQHFQIDYVNVSKQ